MTGAREKTAARLKKEANFYADQFCGSTYGQGLAKIVGNDNIRVLTESFTLIAYGQYGRTPNRWTGEMAAEVVGLDLVDHAEYNDLFVRTFVPILINYVIYVDHEVGYIKNSAALVHGLVDGSANFYETYYDPVEPGIENMPPETLEQLKGESGQQLLAQTDPAEVEMMKEDYHYLKAAQDSHEYLDPEDQKMLEIFEGLFGPQDVSPAKKAGQAQMKLRKKKGKKKGQEKQNKNKHFNFRVNEKEYNKIKSKIEKSELNTSEYLLKTAMNKEIIVIDGLEEIIMQLRKIGNNINQLTKLCNQGRLTNINLEDVKKEMKSIWQLLNLLIQKQS